MTVEPDQSPLHCTLTDRLDEDDMGIVPEWEGNGRLIFRPRPETLVSVSLRPKGTRLDIGRPGLLVDFSDEGIAPFALHPDGRIRIASHAGHASDAAVKAVVGWNWAWESIRLEDTLH